MVKEILDNSSQNEQLKMILYDTCEKRYGSAIPVEIKEELESGLENIEAHGFAGQYLLFHEIATELHRVQTPFIVR